MYDHIQVIERELTEARNILKQCLSIMPVGYVPTHTVENLPEMIGDLTKALAEETTEREKLELELSEAQKQRDILIEALHSIRHRLGDFQEPWNSRETYIDTIAQQAIATVEG
jgi:hypothetical protein